MVENPYSDRIKDFIILWGKKFNEKYSITKIYSKNKINLPIGLPHKKKIKYKPDGAYVLNYKDTIVFEVLDTQIISKTIADLTRCIFNQNVTDLLIIIKNNKDLKIALDTSDVILELFDDYLQLMGQEKKKNKTPLNVHFLKITKTDSKNKKIIEKLFNKKLPKIFNN